MEPRSWLCQLRMRTLANRRDGRLIFPTAEDRGAGDNCGRASGDRLSGSRLVFTTVDLDHGIEPPLHAHLPDTPDLGKHLGQEALTPESRIDCHHEDDVAEMQD